MLFAQRTSIRPSRYAHARRHRRGVTLLETALATIIIGLAVLAMVKLAAVTTQQNRLAAKTTTAAFLADNLHEAMAGLPFCDPASGTTTFGPETGETGLAAFDDVDDFDGWDSATRPDLPNGSPVGVIDAHRQVITTTINGTTQVPPELANFRQQVAVDPVDPNNLSVTFPKPNTARTMVRVTVTVSYRSAGTWTPLTTVRWIKAK